LREAKAIGAVLHPHILAIYDARIDEGTPCLVMELAPGGSMRDRLLAGPLPVDTVREIGIQISRALAAAHDAKIVHRDVKPANILSAQPSVWKLADFGIARLPDSTLTMTGQFLGSPSYAAPESLRACEFSPASDVYGLAATLYEALTGTPPHGNHEVSSLVRKLAHDPAPVHTLRAVPGPLGDAIMQALDRDPAQRPSAAEFARLLAATEYARPRSNKLAYVAIAAAVIAVIMVGFAVRSRTAASATHAKPEQAQRAPVRKQSAPPKQVTPPKAEDNAPPVDDETARRALEDMRRDADEEAERMRRGRGRGRKRHRDPWE
jgi:hypothetical protein